MSDTKQTKFIARRIDIRYPERPSWFRWWRRWLCVLTFLAALAWTVGILIGNLRHGKFDHLLNPAPVTLVHAHFENNCQACHDADGKGGFRKAVSDNACLNCHDGARHHPTADLNPGGSGVPHLMSLTNPLKAADCTACHVEHRGKEANLASDDRLCLQCHENLGAHGGKGTGVANTITVFDGAGHPQFGRSLPTTMPGGAIADTTWGKLGSFHFNHKTHLTRQDPKNGLPIQSCATCHSVEESPSLPAGRRANMRPVSYAEHCSKCHPLALPRTEGMAQGDADLGLPIVHDRLEIVRGQLNDLPHQYMNYLAQTPAVQKALDRGSPAAWVADQMKSLGKIIEQKYPRATEDAFRDRIDKLVTEYKAVDHADISAALDDAADDIAAKVRGSVAAEAEYVAARLNLKTSCEKCHKVTGEMPVIYERLLEFSARASKPTTMPTPLATAPTGIAATPRRWFAHSEFAHTPHRDVSCLTCHTGMDQDEDNGIARMPAMNSCVECHHPPTSEDRGASNNCITCHAFHDRSVERPPTGRLKPLPGVALDK